MKLRRMVALVLSGAVAAVAGGRAKELRPNIVFILADDLGIKDLGCYGSDYYRTPHLDGLAREGMRFTRAYAAAPICSPTRAAILTGRTPHRVHLTDALPWDRLPANPKRIPPEYVKELPAAHATYARALQSAGYRTALVGKWHLGNEHAFFEQRGHEAYGFDEAFEADYTLINEVDKAVEALTDEALAFIERNKGRPFMLSLCHHTTHVPLACPPEYEARYDGVPKGKNQTNQKYAGMVSHLDDSVQRLLEQLKACGIERNTVVVFTSDNGGLGAETSNLPFRGGKSNLYEGGIRIPLVVRWPGVVAAGSLCAVPVHSADWFPTFLDLAGPKPMPEAHVDGQSLLPLLHQRGGFPERDLFWHLPHYREEGPQSAVLAGNWKLIHQIEPDAFELYDLSADPSEARDVAARYPAETARLRNLLEDHLTASGAQRMRANPAWDPACPPGRIRNFGTFYPKQGGTYVQVQDEPYPPWFDRAGEGER